MRQHSKTWWAVVTVAFLVIGLFSVPLADRALGAEPQRCVLENPERPCYWDYPPIHTHFVRHDPHWYQLSHGYRFPKGHFFDVMHKAYYDATHGQMDQATLDAKADLRRQVRAYRAGDGARIDCGTMFTCWWGGLRHDMECIGSVVTQYGCTAAAPDSPSDEMVDEYMHNASKSIIVCGLGGAMMVSTTGPAVIGEVSVCLVGAWIMAWF